MNSYRCWREDDGEQTHRPTRISDSIENAASEYFQHLCDLGHCSEWDDIYVRDLTTNKVYSVRVSITYDPVYNTNTPIEVPE